MPRFLHRKQKNREFGFVPIHGKVQQEIRRRCTQCGKWIVVIKLGFCRYRFVEHHSSIDHKAVASPWTPIRRKYTNHICTVENYCSSFSTPTVNGSNGENEPKSKFYKVLLENNIHLYDVGLQKSETRRKVCSNGTRNVTDNLRTNVILEEMI